MKNLIYILISIVSLSSCMSGQNNKNNIGNYTIPDSLYSFFPDNSKDCEQGIVATNAGDVVGISIVLQEFDVSFLVKVYSCKDVIFFDSLKANFSKKAIEEFKSEDSTYFVIGSERDILRDYDTLKLKEKYHNYQDKPLILSFHSVFNEEPMFYSSSTICGLPKNYEILVLKSGYDYVLEEKYKYDWNILPDKLKHGYTAGVAFKETEPYIIYWVVTW